MVKVKDYTVLFSKLHCKMKEVGHASSEDPELIYPLLWNVIKEQNEKISMKEVNNQTEKAWEKYQRLDHAKQSYYQFPVVLRQDYKDFKKGTKMLVMGKSDVEAYNFAEARKYARVMMPNDECVNIPSSHFHTCEIGSCSD